MLSEITIIFLQASEAISSALKGMDAASESLVATQAINYMLISILILLFVSFGMVVRWLWSQVKDANERDKIREQEDNQFKSQYLDMLKTQNQTSKQNGELIRELKQYIENTDSKKLQEILIKLSDKL